MRMSHEDVAQLTEEQKRRLTQLWMPQRYDIAVAYICKDVENDEYEKYEFVVGNATLNEYARLFLHDLKAPESSAVEEEEVDIAEEVAEDENEDEDEDDDE